MEVTNRVPLFGRFGFRLMLFAILLIVSISGPYWIVRRGDYKPVLDRMTVQRGLFLHALEELDGQPITDWGTIVDELPELLHRQRLLIVAGDGSIEIDSGVSGQVDLFTSYGLWFPHPYDESSGSIRAEAIVHAVSALAGREAGYYSRTQQIVRSVTTAAGTDRLAIHSGDIRSAGGESHSVILSSSVVDLLLQNRALKERLIVLSVIVGAVGLALTIVLSRSVTAPLRWLYSSSRKILGGTVYPSGGVGLHARGEIGVACRAQLRLTTEIHSRAERFLEFSSDIVHEMKKPLTAIRSGFELLSDGRDDSSRAEIHERIGRRIQAMDVLIDEISDLSKIEALAARDRCTELNTVVRDIAEEFERFKPNVATHGLLTDAVLPLSCSHLRRIISNLLQNATSFSPQAGSVSLTVTVDDDMVSIRVEDTGPGIHVDAYDHLTDRFYSYRPEHDRTGHVGLGLSVVSSVLVACHGRLRYYNRHGGGAVFEATIPIL